MKVITVTRTHKNKDGVYGTIDDDGIPFAQTVEPPDRGNQPFISCTPIGERVCKRYSSEKYPDVWQIVGVPGRDFVLFHWGNFPSDTQGCIIVGENFSQMKDRQGREVTAVANSRNTANQGFLELMERTKGLDEFKLVIREPLGWKS